VAQKLKGTWWVPGGADTPVPGHLKIGRRHGDLTLILKAPLFGQDAQKLHHSSTLHGALEDGDPVTLWTTEPLLPAGANDRHQLWVRHVHYALVGDHLGDRDSVTFERSVVRFENLSRWSSRRAPEHQGEETATFSPYGEPYEVTMALQAPTIERLTANGVVVSDPSVAGVPAITYDFEPAAPMAFLDWMLHDTVGLLTFCYQARAHLTERYVMHAGIQLRVYARHTHRPIGRAKTPRSMVLSAETIDPGVLFPAWWAVTSRYYPLPQILAGRFYTRGAYLEHHLLAAVAALESVYDQLDLPADRMDRSVFKERRKWHLENEPDEQFHKVLTEQITNRQTLRMKMGILGEHIGDELMGVAAVTRSEWIQHVMAVRNNLAHSGSHVKGVGDDTATELEDVDRETRAVLTLLLCQLIGASESALRQAAFALHPRPFTIPLDRPGSDLIEYG
jgi:hypothetical protein